MAWIKQYKGFFIITNEKGQPMQWNFTKSEQFDEVKDVFKQLSERFNRQGKKSVAFIRTVVASGRGN